MSVQVSNRDQYDVAGNLLAGALVEANTDSVRRSYSDLRYSATCCSGCHYSKLVLIFLVPGIPNTAFVQRNKLAGTLNQMEAAGWIQETHDLHGLAQELLRIELPGEKYCLPMATSERASIHHGAMTVKIKKGPEGRRQDYQVFCAFKLDDGGHELTVMQVEGIARISGPNDADGAGAAEAHGGGDDVAATWPKKIAWGRMCSCEPAVCRGSETEYTVLPQA